MIKTNFIRYGKRKKTKTFKLRVSLYFLFVFFMIVLTILTDNFTRNLSFDYQRKVSSKKYELKNALNMVKKSAEKKKAYNLIMKKVGKIESLRKQNKNLTEMIKRVSEASDGSNIRLSSFSIGKGKIVIEGYSFDTFKIKNFIKDMKHFEGIKDTHLKLVEKNDIKGYPKLKFVVICTKNI